MSSLTLQADRNPTLPRQRGIVIPRKHGFKEDAEFVGTLRKLREEQDPEEARRVTWSLPKIDDR